MLAQQVSRARGLEPQVRAESEVERSAHRETMQALDLSEQSVGCVHPFLLLCVFELPYCFVVV